MKELVENIEKQISTDKEVISVLPRNGIRAIKSLLETIKDMTDKYEALNENVLQEIAARYDRLTDVEENVEIHQIEEEILRYDVAVRNTDTRSSFEKMGLDKISYNVNGYYKSNLERLNTELIECVKQFQNVGIKLSAQDFDVSEYAKKYMDILLQESNKGNINSELVKSTFEKVYWECSDVVTHLYVSIKYLYDKYENEIDKFYQNKAEEILKSFNSTAEGVEDKKVELINKKKKIEATDNRIILNKFFTGAMNINDFKLDNYTRIYLELTSKELAKISEKEKADMDQNIAKLNDNLNEYARYCEYKFLVDEILELRQEELKKNEENKSKKVKKTDYDLSKENIKKIKSEIFKINGKIDKPSKGLFGLKSSNDKKKNEEILKRNNLILDLKKEYLQLDTEIIRQKIVQNIDETSSLLDVLKFASSYYGFMARAMIKKNEEITDKEIGEEVKKVRDFINFSDFKVINNVKISDTKDLAVIIKDKYKLFGMQVSKENFQEDNLEDLIKKVKIVSNYNNIKKSKYSIDDLEYIVSVKEMLKK